MLGLRVGDWVEVRSAEEILGSLDERQSLEGLPFMPEMLQYCGKRFRVHKTAHKTCDTIQRASIRRMSNAVHLEGLRCDGAAHGGCQAGCLLFWKEAWLKRVSSDVAHDRIRTGTDGLSHAKACAALQPGTRVPSTDASGAERFRCQATDLLAATTEVRRRDRWDPRLYVKDLTSGNVRFRDFIRHGAMAALNAFAARWFGRRLPHLCGAAVHQTPTGTLNLQPGEAVQVRSKQEIMQTLGPTLRNRGLLFDVEMVPYCEQGTYRVLTRVERIIDERTGQMIELPNPCLILDGVTCSGNLSQNRMFCPRGLYPFWREIWLKRAEGSGETGCGGAA